MTLTVTSYGDNPQQPGILAETYIPDQLIAGRFPLVSQPILLASGTLQRGAVLGKQTSPSSFSVVSTTGASNTGNGTVGTISAAATPTFGAFTLVATGSTTFTVIDPEGVALPNATVGTPYTNAEINFTITAGGTAFVAGDNFTLSVMNTVGSFIKCVKTASDGSQTPAAILVDYADASGGAVKAGGYVSGEFNINAISFDSSWTIEQLMAAMPAPIFLKETQGAYSASDPS